jgi:hypothetical protein
MLSERQVQFDPHREYLYERNPLNSKRNAQVIAERNAQVMAEKMTQVLRSE